VAKRYREPNTLTIGPQARTGVAGNEGRSMDFHRCATSFRQIGDSIAVEGAWCQSHVCQSSRESVEWAVSQGGMGMAQGG